MVCVCFFFLMPERQPLSVQPEQVEYAEDNEIGADKNLCCQKRLCSALYIFAQRISFKVTTLSFDRKLFILTT